MDKIKQFAHAIVETMESEGFNPFEMMAAVAEANLIVANTLRKSFPAVGVTKLNLEQAPTDMLQFIEAEIKDNPEAPEGLKSRISEIIEERHTQNKN